jgi:hypothetical protein
MEEKDLFKESFAARPNFLQTTMQQWKASALIATGRKWRNSRRFVQWLDA